MNKDTIDRMFEDLSGQFDTQTPPVGHQERFLDRIRAQKKRPTARTRSLWAPLSMAATLLILVGLALGQFTTAPSVTEQVAKISPEIGQTQFYFSSLVEEQIKDLEARRSPKTEKIIGDTMAQMQALESDFSLLEEELINGGNSKLILSAMITNFQTRIDLLQSVMEQIEQLTTVKNITDEEHTL